MRLSPITLTSLVGALLVACSEMPATSTDTASTIDTTGDSSSSTSSSSTPTESSASSTSEPEPTTSGDPPDTTGSTMSEGSCGDGIIDPGEGCDAGPANGPGNPCNSQCQLSACGDGELGPGEQCDDGADNADDAACTTECTTATCGDGRVWTTRGGEECDNGPENGPGKLCNAQCLLNICGDGDPGPDEECDLGAGNDNTGACTLACQLPECGDGFVQPGIGETCDDGNTVDRDACPSTCDEGATQVLEVVMGLYHTCARLPEGRVKCWGYSAPTGSETIGPLGDEPGEMGDALPYVNLGTGVEALALASGEKHVCAIVTDGHVKCWGANGAGQLGLGDSVTRGAGPNEMGDFLPYVGLGTGQTATAITAGDDFTCVILTGGGVKCWGQGGRLGLGDTLPRGIMPDQMGDNLPLVDLGTNKKAVSIDAGAAHTCAVLDDNTIKCWGYGPSGRLGLGDGNSKGYGPGEMGDNLPAVQLGLGKVPVRVTAGTDHTCALLVGGLVKCWGLGSHGQLGNGDTDAVGNDPNEMGDFLPAVKLGAGKLAGHVTAGDARSCAVLTDHRVKCWGYQYLGFGGMNIGTSPDEMGDNLPLIDLGTDQLAKEIHSNYQRICVLLQNDRLKCWGSGTLAGLGYGDTLTRGTDDESMGDNLPFIDL